MPKWPKDEKVFFCTVTYLVYQQECCPDTGRMHIQGYVELENRVRFKKLLSEFPGTHWEKRKGSAEEASDYCKKDISRAAGGIMYEFGKLSKMFAGKRTDIDDAVDMLKSGASMRDVALTHSSVYVRMHRGLTALQGELIEARVSGAPREIIILWGSPGSGKSLFATLFPNVYRPDRNNQGKLSFESYAGQKTLFFDEFSGSENLSVSDLKIICDRHDVRLPGRGMSVIGNHDRVVIASNVDPRLWYATSEDIYWRPMLRRITIMYRCDNSSNWEIEVFRGEEKASGTESFDPCERFGLVMTKDMSVLSDIIKPKFLGGDE